MRRRWLLAAALSLCVPSAGHADSDPFWDGSLVREGKAAAPPPSARPNASREKRKKILSFAAPSRRQSRVGWVPSPGGKPAAVKITEPRSRQAPNPVPWGLGAAGAALAGAGLILLASTESPPPRPVWIWKPEDDEPAPKGPTLVEPETASPVPNDYISPAPPSSPAYAEPWWAISAAEQAAIDRWNESFEKELGIESLDRWLDANADTLPRVDTELLKKKLSRDA